MTDAGQMNANLMSPAGADFNLQKRVRTYGFQDIVVGDRGAPGPQLGRHPNPANRVPSDRRSDMARSRFRMPVHQREINLLYLPVVKLRSQGLMGTIRSRYHDQATRVTVETMNNARTDISVQGGQSSEVMQQSIHERALMLPGTGVDNHACGLVDYNDILILVQKR